MKQQLLNLIKVCLLALPWLNPFALGPAPSIVTSLGSAIALLILLLIGSTRDSAHPHSTQSHAISRAWLLAALISVLIAQLQYLGYAAEATSTSTPWVSFAHIGEAYGNLRQRNQFATLTNIGLAALLWVQSSAISIRPTGLSHNNKKTHFQIGVFALAALLAVGNAASGSRTGLFELFCLVGMAWIWRPRESPWTKTAQYQTLLVAGCSYCLAAIGLPLLIGLDPGSTGILGRLQDVEASCQSRRVLWANVLHLISQEPWFGWGWGELDYAHFITLYPSQRFCDILDNAHNLPLHLAVELGVPFALLGCGIMVWLVVRQAPWRETTPARQLGWAVLALIALHSMLEYPLWYGPFQMSVLLAILILWRTSPPANSAAEPGPIIHTAVRRMVAAVSCSALLCCVYAAWDYWRISQVYTPPPERAQSYREDTLQKLQSSWLFSNYVKFAELTTTPLTSDNARYLNALALEMLHFSPEPKVARMVIESAMLIGRETEAAYYLRRFKAAFPQEDL